MDVQRIAIVAPSDETREELRNQLLGVESVWLEAECSNYEFFADLVQQSNPEIALLNVDFDQDVAISLIGKLKKSHPDMSIIAVSSRNDGPFIMQLMRGGANEFVSFPIQMQELLQAFQSIGPGTDSHGVKTKQTKVIAICGARGGVGCTSLGVNLGCAMAARDPSNQVALVDLDLTMGDADVCLDIIPDYTLADVALSIDRIDLQMLKRSLSKHESGLYLLPHPVQIEDASLIHQDHIGRVLSLLKMAFTHLILDLSKSYHPIDFAAMDFADEIVMVIQLDVSNLRNVVRLNASLGEREGMSDKVKVVANRVGSDENEIGVQRAEETIGRKILAKIPNDSRTMMESRNNGVPLIQHAPRSKLYLAIDQLAEGLLSGTFDEKQGPKKGGKGFFFFSSSD